MFGRLKSYYRKVSSVHSPAYNDHRITGLTSFLFSQSAEATAHVGSRRRLTCRRKWHAREGIVGFGSAPQGSAMIVQDDIGLEQTVWLSTVDGLRGE